MDSDRTVTVKGLMPRYATDFGCVASQCPEHCCGAWKILVDRRTFQLARKTNSDLGRRYQRVLERNEAPAADHQYARIASRPADGHCPLLSDGLCEVHAALGPELLCDICFHYPRRVLEFAGTHYQALDPSCPIVARQVLLAKDGLALINAKIRVRESYINHAIPQYGLSLDRMLAVRNFCLSVMQARELPFSARMLSLGTLCEGLQRSVDATQVPDVEALMAEATVAGLASQASSAIGSGYDLGREAIAFAALMTSFPVSANTEASQRVFDEVIRGLTGETARQVVDAKLVVSRYAAGTARLPRVLARVPSPLDRYAENDMIGGGFPFLQRQPMGAFLGLAGRLATLRFLLVARSANDNPPDAEALVETLFVFSRGVTHHFGLANAMENVLGTNGWTTARSVSALFQ